MNADSVLNLLEVYCPSDEREEEHVEAVVRLLRNGDAAWCRDNDNPGHLTASSFLVDSRTCSVALIFHGKLKRWLQPGGHVDSSDENPLAAARRELLEETGVETPQAGWVFLDIDIHRIPARAAQAAHKHYDLRFALVMDRAERVPLSAGDDAEDACWMPLSALAESGEDGLIRCYRKLKRILSL